MKKNKLILFISICVLGLLLIILFIPTLLSTQWGKNRLAHTISPELKIDSLHLSWIGPQEITGISHPQLTCRSVRTNASIWALIIRKDLGNLHIEKPHIVLPQSTQVLSSSSTPPASKTTTCLSSASSTKSIPFTGKLTVSDGEVAMKNTVYLNQIDIAVNLPRTSSPITFQMSGLTCQESTGGRFDLNGSLEPGKEELILEGDLSHFPIKGIDQMVSLFRPEASGFLTEAIGPSFDAHIHAKILNDGPAFQLNASASHFQANIQTIAQNGNLVLKNPAKITLHVIPKLMQRLSGFSPKVETKVQITLNELSIPLQAPLHTSFLGTLQITRAQLATNLQLDNALFDFQSQKLSDSIQFQGESQWQFTAPYSNLLGNAATLQTKGSLALNPLAGNVTLSLASDRLNIPSLPFTFSEPCSRVTLQTPSSFTYLAPQEHAPIQLTLKEASIPLENLETMTVELIAKTPSWKQFEDVLVDLNINGWNQVSIEAREKDFFLKMNGGYQDNRLTLYKPLFFSGTFSNHLFPENSLPLEIRPSPFEFRIQPFSIALNQNLVPQLKMRGSGIIENLTLYSKEKDRTFALEKVVLTSDIDASQKTIQANLASKGLNLTFSLTDLLFNKTIETEGSTLSLNLTLQKFSSALIESWMKSYYPLQATLGPYFNLQFKAFSSPLQQTLSLNADSKYFSTQLAFAAKDGMLHLTTPGAVDWTITPEGFELLTYLFDQKNHFKLEKQSYLKGTLTAVQLPIIMNPQPTSVFERFPKIQGNFADIIVQGKASIESMALSEKYTHRSAYLKFLNFSIDKATAQVPLLLHLDGLASAPGTKVREGKISLDAKLANLYTPEGAFDKNSMVANIEASLIQVPTLILDLFNHQGKLSKLLGPSVTLTLNTQIQQMSGPVHLSLNAPNTKASINGMLQSGVLYLSEPIYTQLNLTPDVSNFILGSANPLSISRISSDNPLSLQIDSNGFVLPLFPFNVSQMQIGKARIELGKIRCTNDGTLKFTLGLLKSDRLVTSNELLLWFAPMDLSLSQGILNIERTEVLIGETFDLALWGNIDIARDYADIVLGLTADALRAAFGIRNLPKNYVMQLPLRGPLNNISINKSAATAKIAALMIWQNQALQGVLRGSGIGAIVGGIISRVAPLPDFNKTPPPPKRPFPWEEPQPELKKSAHKSRHSFEDKPLKQILKLLR